MLSIAEMPVSFAIFVCSLLTLLSLTRGNSTGTENNFTEIFETSKDKLSKDVLQDGRYPMTVVPVQLDKLNNLSRSNDLTLEPPEGRWSGTYMDILNTYFSCSTAGTVPPSWDSDSPSLFSYAEVIYYNCSGCENSTTILHIFMNVTKLSFLDNAQFKLTCTSGDSTGTITVIVLPGSSVSCNGTSDCELFFLPKSLCRKNVCICTSGVSQLYCNSKVSLSRTSQTAIFKAAMIAVACFTAAVLTAFTLFFLNRRRICRSLRPRYDGDDDTGSRRGSDVFSVSDALARERLSDKPPTYQEVLRRDRMSRGMPPPAYTSPGNDEGDSPTASSSDTPAPRYNRTSRTAQNSPEHILIARLAAELQRRGRTQPATRTSTSEEERQNNSRQNFYDNQAFSTDS